MKLRILSVLSLLVLTHHSSIFTMQKDDVVSKPASPKKDSALITASPVDLAQLESIVEQLDISPIQTYKPASVESPSADTQAHQLAQELVGWQSTINVYAKEEFYGSFTIKPENTYAPAHPLKDCAD